MFQFYFYFERNIIKYLLTFIFQSDTIQQLSEKDGCNFSLKKEKIKLKKVLDKK